MKVSQDSPAPLTIGTPPSQPGTRLAQIDLLRGLVMVLMVLDHTRHYFTDAQFDPTDLARTTPAYFFTRWITHFCAPVFVFLAGASAFLHGARLTRRSELTGFLFTRGIWLVLLEITLIRLGWFFDLNYSQVVFQVIWVIGISMLALGLLLWLPTWARLALAVLLIGGHNLLDPVRAADLGAFGWLWHLLHEPGDITPPIGPGIFVLYPALPWMGVMLAGFEFGRCVMSGQGRPAAALVGMVLTLLFLLLRAGNVYGDPAPWQSQPDLITSVMAFLNTEKYPPSLLFLCMTLGPALLLFSALPAKANPIGSILVVYGRVPLFLYVAHIFAIHAAAFGVGSLRPILTGSSGPAIPFPPHNTGFPLPIVYLLWLLIVIALYQPCLWFGHWKQANRQKWWVSYL